MPTFLYKSILLTTYNPDNVLLGVCTGSSLGSAYIIHIRHGLEYLGVGQMLVLSDKFNVFKVNIHCIHEYSF